MMTITEFLLARIAEDEAQAHELIRRQRRKLTVRDVSLGYVRAFDPKFIAAECEAKRRIVDEHIFTDALDHPYRGHIEASYCVSCHVQGPCPTLRALATVYADHPDYDQAWRAGS